MMASALEKAVALAATPLTKAAGSPVGPTAISTKRADPGPFRSPVAKANWLAREGLALGGGLELMKARSAWRRAVESWPS